MYWCSTSQRRSSLTLAGQRSLSSPAELLSLSNQYSAATAAAQRAAALAAGEAMVAVFHGTAFQVSYVLGLRRLYHGTSDRRSHAACPEHGHEEVGGAQLAAFLIDDWHGVAGLVLAAHDHVDPGAQLRQRSQNQLYW